MPSTIQYVKGEGGITISQYLCSCHGRPFPSKAAMQIHVREYRKSVCRDLQNLVSSGGLGQNAWDRLPGETPQQFARFKCYLTSANRSTHAVARILGLSGSAIRSVASKWHWIFRAECWDRWVDQREFEEYAKEKQLSARKQARLGRKLQEAALKGAGQLLNRISSGDAEVSGNEIAKLADVGVKIERLANSDPTAIKEDRGITLVWEGPRPAWAPVESDQGPQQLESGEKAHA